MSTDPLRDFVACGAAAQAAVNRVIEAADLAYSGLIKHHAQEISKLETFRRSGKLTTNQVHAVQRDLDRLARKHPITETMEKILERVDALELERGS